MHSCKRVGVAVSGGPDSMALLHALLNKREPLGFPLFVISVNHNIRPKKESVADARFVKNFCTQHNIDCDIITFEENEVAECEKKRSKGIEEAARYLRYAAFEAFVAKYELDVLCLGHTKSDQLETLLQRFLQGSDVSSMAGIPKKRGYFFRPLFECSRDQIMQYIDENKIPYVLDKTNDENDYLRNKTRNILIPILNQYYKGWQTALLHGAEKITDDVELIDSLVKSIDWQVVSESEVSLPAALFFEQHRSIQRRLLQRAMTLINCKHRVPYSFFMEFLKTKKLTGYGLNIEISADLIIVKQQEHYRKQGGFSAIIESIGQVCFFSFSADIVDKTSCINKQENSIGPFSLPVIIRNANSADLIRMADGKYKKVNEIFSSWKVPQNARFSIPIIESSGEVTAICASFLGYKNWYVQDTCADMNQVYIHFKRN